MTRIAPILLLTLLPWLGACSEPSPGAISELSPAETPVRGEVVFSDLDHPWSLAFLPDGRLLVTERSGRLLRLDPARGTRSEVAGLPPIAVGGQGGLLDVVLHPDFASNRLVYFSYVAAGAGGRGTEVARARLDGDRLTGLEVLFRQQPKSGTGRHFGSRLVFDRDGHLFITLGDRGERERAQALDDHAGSVIRLDADGAVPADNPFVATPGAHPGIYSYGHRNLQGAALHPDTGALWSHEHGPRGGDEINIIRPGVNYGWPEISYGREYVSQLPVGARQREGMAQPLYYWDPSIAPSGMTFYTGDRYPGWRGSLLLGSLKFQLLVRLTLDGERVVAEERLLKGEFGRIRDVRQGPDGYLYLLIDAGAPAGKLIRLVATPVGGA